MPGGIARRIPAAGTYSNGSRAQPTELRPDLARADRYIRDIVSAKLRAMTGSYVKVGSGDHRVLALHGWFGSALGWGSLPDYLDERQFTYVFPDLRGYGSRRDEPGEFTMAEAAADAIALADSLGWDRFSLVGHSMSGVAIQHVLLQAPQPGAPPGRRGPGPGQRSPARRVGMVPVQLRRRQPREPRDDRQLRDRQPPDPRVRRPGGPALPARTPTRPRSAATWSRGPAPTSSPASRAARSRSR